MLRRNTGRCRVKKAVVGVTEMLAALVPIHDMLALAMTVSFIHHSGKTFRLSVTHLCLGPVLSMVLLSCVVVDADLLCSDKLDTH